MPLKYKKLQGTAGIQPIQTKQQQRRSLTAQSESDGITMHLQSIQQKANNATNEQQTIN
jgi:hypothetical protein